MEDDKYFTEEEDGWYFWDEVWAFKVGPFCDRERCEEVFLDYCDTLGIGKD